MTGHALAMGSCLPISRWPERCAGVSDHHPPPHWWKVLDQGGITDWATHLEGRGKMIMPRKKDHLQE